MAHRGVEGRGADGLRGRGFVAVTASVVLFFTAFGMSLPVLPLYVIEELSGGEVSVGVVYAAYAVAALAVRPPAGQAAATYGRRVVIVVGCLLSTIGLVAHLMADGVGSLVMLRMAVGAGQALVMLGLVTVGLDLAPPSRRGEAASYLTIGAQVGLGLGPLLGETALRFGGYDAVWIAASSGGLICLILMTLVEEQVQRDGPGSASRRLFHTAALRPGSIQFLGACGFAGFLSFVPLLALNVGMERVAFLYVLASGTVVGFRLLAAKLPDRLGPLSTARFGFTMMGTGLVAMAALEFPSGIYLSAVVMAAGWSLVPPSLLLAATQRAPSSERSQVVATYTMFTDLGSSVGPPTLGFVAALSSYRGAFIVAGLFGFVALALVQTWHMHGEESVS